MDSRIAAIIFYGFSFVAVATAGTIGALLGIYVVEHDIFVEALVIGASLTAIVLLMQGAVSASRFGKHYRSD